MWECYSLIWASQASAQLKLTGWNNKIIIYSYSYRALKMSVQHTHSQFTFLSVVPIIYHFTISQEKVYRSVSLSDGACIGLKINQSDTIIPFHKLWWLIVHRKWIYTDIWMYLHLLNSNSIKSEMFARHSPPSTKAVTSWCLLLGCVHLKKNELHSTER